MNAAVFVLMYRVSSITALLMHFMMTCCSPAGGLCVLRIPLASCQWEMCCCKAVVVLSSCKYDMLACAPSKYSVQAMSSPSHWVFWVW
jgi:hypothetical protein